MPWKRLIGIIASLIMLNSISALTRNADIAGTSTIEIDNNIVLKHPIAISNALQANGTQILRNNLFWQNGTNEDGNPCDFVDCLATDPQLDNSYQPIWNSTTMSPCIDNGIGDKDPVDNTPPDIGALRAVSHEYWDWTNTKKRNPKTPLLPNYLTPTALPITKKR